MTTDPRPLPFDPTKAVVAAMIDANDAEWLLTRPGDFSSYAVETMRADGSGFQRLVAVEWPCRPNKGTDERTVRLLMSPDDARGLAEVLAHAAAWIDAANRIGN